MKDSAPFTFDFALDGKAVVAEVPEESGLRIEGYAAGFNTDRMDEAFLPGAFEKSLKTYMETNPILCYHHHYDQALGVVEDAKLDGKGLFVKARLDAPEPGTPLADVYNKVKSGTIKGFSVGGIFKRKQTPRGPRIHTADIAEISVTPLPMEPGSLFALAGKAFGTEPDLEEAARMLQQLDALGSVLNSLEEATGKAMASGYMRNEKPTLTTPGDVAKAVDRAASGVEEEEALREHIMCAAKQMDCMNLIPEAWLEDDEYEVEGKAVSAEKRRNAKYHFPGTDKYPIDNRTDLENAISRSGSSTESKSAVQAYLIRVAKALNAADLIPKDWLK